MRIIKHWRESSLRRQRFWNHINLSRQSCSGAADCSVSIKVGGVAAHLTYGTGHTKCCAQIILCRTISTCERWWNVVPRSNTGPGLSDGKNRKYKHASVNEDERDVVQIVRQVTSVQCYANDKQKCNVESGPEQDKHQHVGENRH